MIGAKNLKNQSAFLASEAYGSVQGYQSWYYMEWKANDYQEMTFNSKENRWEGLSPSCSIGWGSPQVLHPGENSDCARVFRCPYDGEIAIDGTIKKCDLGGDGVRSKILHNGVQVWPNTDWAITEGQDKIGIRTNISLLVKEGDTIEFLLNSNHTTSHDSTAWDPLVVYPHADPQPQLHYKTLLHNLVMYTPFFITRNGIFTLYYLEVMPLFLPFLKI